ncbi:hypothetical protein N806_05170 [Rhodococcus sp. P27]|nr:hypothetical protein N806_05170 [Rhodococcus sp. P27]
MTEFVVDGLHAVQIDDDDRSRIGELAVPGLLGLEDAVPPAPIEKTCQRVGLGIELRSFGQSH